MTLTFMFIRPFSTLIMDDLEFELQGHLAIFDWLGVVNAITSQALHQICIQAWQLTLLKMDDLDS